MDAGKHVCLVRRGVGTGTAFIVLDPSSDTHLPHLLRLRSAQSRQRLEPGGNGPLQRPENSFVPPSTRAPLELVGTVLYLNLGHLTIIKS